MVSFPDLPGRVSLEEIERHWPDLLPTLVDHDGVGFLLVHSDRVGPVVLGRDGLHRLASGVVIGADPLLPYGEHAADLVARVSLPALRRRVINSRYDPDTDEASAFEPHVGSHGGLGGPQQRAVSSCTRGRSPRRARSSAPSTLHRVLRGWLTDLGHPEPRGLAAGDADRETAAVQA